MNAAKDELDRCAMRAEEQLPAVMAELEARMKAVNDLRVVEKGLRTIIEAAKAAKAMVPS